jgi:uncharacterized caspase-like protein
LTTSNELDYGNYHALIIGIDDYAEIEPLETAVSDAQAIEQILRARYGFTTTLLRNASRYEILSTLNRLRRELTSNDNLLIYYAGHGILVRENNRGFWLPGDANKDNTANWISNVALTDTLNLMKAKHILVVSDSCYSGSLTRSSLPSLETGMTNSERIQFLKTLIRQKSRTALTSGGLTPVLDGGEGGHSVFTGALLRALEQNKEPIEGLRLFREVSAKVAFAASEKRFEQLPQYAPIKHSGHEAGDFVLVPKHP